ncbi:MAG: hypothetical protein AAFQ82_19400, partial [Myxococcota bacterium]
MNALLLTAFTPVAAQDPKPAQDTIVVRGEALRGRTLTDVEPELVLSEEDIAAYGASSLGELLSLLEAEYASSRGRSQQPPVVLLNGRRISGFREIGRYPAEAVERVEIFPEEVSLRYGFSADQRVINFILKANTKITAVQGSSGAPEEGGATFLEASLQHLVVDGDKRRSSDADYRRDPAIREEERSTGAEDARFRTLTSERDAWNTGFSYARPLTKGIITTLTGTYGEALSQALLGEQTVTEAGGPQRQVSFDNEAYLGFAITSPLAATTWNVTSNVTRQENAIRTDPSEIDSPSLDGFVRDSTISTVAVVDAILNDRSLRIGGEKATLAMKLGATWEQLESEETGGVGRAPSFEIDRSTLTTSVSTDWPITFIPSLPGRFSVNGNVLWEELSDQGGFLTAGGGFTWLLAERVQVIGSFTAEEGAAGLADIQAPSVETPGQRVFDPQLGTDVITTVIAGGNAALTSDRRRVQKVGLQIKPWLDKQNRFNVDYTQSVIDDEVRSFGVLTEEFERAFPGRVQRD